MKIIRFFIVCLLLMADLIEQIDLDDMRMYLKQDRDNELQETRRIAEILAQEQALTGWEN